MCGIFVLYVFAFSPVLLWMKSEIKTEMKQKINNHSIDSESALLCFNEKEFKTIQWIEESEFMYDGILYDLLNIDKKENGQYILKVVLDKEEGEVMKTLSDNSDSNSPTNKCTHLLFQLFSQYCSAHEAINLCNYHSIIETSFTYLNLYSYLDFKKISTPPKLV